MKEGGKKGRQGFWQAFWWACCQLISIISPLQLDLGSLPPPAVLNISSLYHVLELPVHIQTCSMVVVRHGVVLTALPSLPLSHYHFCLQV